MYAIESGVPTPPIIRPCETNKELRPTLEALEIGQSFLVPQGKYRNREAARASIRAMCRKLGIVTTTRTTSLGLRVWRIE